MTAHVVARVTVPGRIDAVRPVAAFLVDVARRLEVAAASASLFENAVVEALNNAVEHSARQPDGSVHCEVELDGRRFTIRLLDEAAPTPVALTAPADMAPPVPQSWQDIPESGYGLYLMRAVFSDIRPVTHKGRHGIEMSLAV